MQMAASATVVAGGDRNATWALEMAVAGGDVGDGYDCLGGAWTNRSPSIEHGNGSWRSRRRRAGGGRAEVVLAEDLRRSAVVADDPPRK